MAGQVGDGETGNTAQEAQEEVVPRDGEGGRRQRSLSSISFIALLLTQLLTAVNDNVFRWLAIGIGKDYVDPSHVGNILMAGTACFVIPYLVLAAPAGYLADRFSKRQVIIGCKIAEVVIMTLGIVAISCEAPPTLNLIFLFTVVALMGAQSALFSPSKMGSIPELLPREKISAANGLFGLATVSATVIGMVLGSWLSDATGFRGKERWWLSAVVLLSIAAVGLGLSLLIRRLPVANARRKFPWDVFSQTWRDLRRLASNRALLRVALGVVFFWSVGALAQLNIDQFAFEGGALNETDKIPLLISLIAGVGFGSVLAGIWSGDHIELGILPIGAFGVAACSILLFTAQGTILESTDGVTMGLVWACLLLLALGTSAGLFSVPLEAYLQHRSPVETRGSILAATNFLVFSGVLCSAIGFAALRYPVYSGQLANVAALQESWKQLTPAQRADVDRLDAEFAQAWKLHLADRPTTADDKSPADPRSHDSVEAPQMTESIERAEPAERTAVIARLMWTELKQRQAAGDFLDKYDYYELFQEKSEVQLAKEVFDQATDLPLMTARQIFFLAGVFTLPVFLYIVFVIPQASVRFLAWLAGHTLYRIRVFHRERLPQTGGALLVSNHVSWLDGIFLLLTSSRPVRVVAFVKHFRGRVFRGLARLAGVILVSPEPDEARAALEAAREALRRGELVGIFPEGRISRSGQIQPFRGGLLRVMEGVDVPVVPVYMDELWGSIFSFHGGKFFWKWPRRLPYPVSIHFGKPLSGAPDRHELRRAVQDLGARAIQERTETMPRVTTEFLRNCKRQKWRSKVADSLGAELKGGSLLMRTLILRRLLSREVLASDERHIGLLLPPTVPAMVVNAALALDRRVAVNLNYTVSSRVLQSCIDQAGIKHVLTSRKFMEKFDFELDVDLVYAEDLREKISIGDKLAAAFQAYALPAGGLVRLFKTEQVPIDDLLTIIFTSGSTGDPKGVMLTHGNVASNVKAVETVVRITPDDVVLGILPFFHSFGYTITMWTALSLDLKGVYHFNPLDARQVGKLCREQGGTLLLATPTFLRSYARRCQPEDFSSLDVVVTGAERLPPEVADQFEAKFGVRPVEGYGCTETAPLASVNIPAARSHDPQQHDAKEGTVGRPIPGVSARIVDLDTGERLPPGEAGMLLIKGPNIMRGYYGRQDLTDAAIQDGWYTTGDVALIDDDGFIRITGRESRFSKIGGEMIPHIQIEEELARIIGDSEDGLRAVVTAVPDPRKGERLVVVHTRLEQSPAEFAKKLSEAGLPNIYIPSPDSYVEVDELPILGTGKLDLRSIRQTALDHFAKPKDAAE